MNPPRYSLAVLFVALLYSLLVSNHFGWNFLPKTDAEVIADGISAVLLLLALNLHRQESANSAKKKVTDEIEQTLGALAYHAVTNIGKETSTMVALKSKGMVKNMSKNFRHLCKTKHTHHPVEDAKGHAEALLAMRDMGLKIIPSAFSTRLRPTNAQATGTWRWKSPTRWKQPTVPAPFSSSPLKPARTCSKPPDSFSNQTLPSNEHHRNLPQRKTDQIHPG